MTTDIKELVQRLREVFVEDRGHGHTTEWTRNLDGPEAADALEAMAGEVDALKHDIARHMAIANEAAAERNRLKAELKTASQLLHDTAVREGRLKAALNKKLSAKARQKLGDLSESMIAMGEGRALEMLLNWYDDSRKALGGDE